jgi:hypothetical protein
MQETPLPGFWMNSRLENAFAEIIASSFLSDVFKQRYLDLINERLSRLKT